MIAIKISSILFSVKSSRKFRKLKSASSCFLIKFLRVYYELLSELQDQFIESFEIELVKEIKNENIFDILQPFGAGR